MDIKSQIIHVENEYNDEINDFFIHHMDNILSMIRKNMYLYDIEHL
jgi:hypothetical protein